MTETVEPVVLDVVTRQSTALCSYEGVQILAYPQVNSKIGFGIFEGGWTYKGIASVDSGRALAAKSAPALVVFEDLLLMVYEGIAPDAQLYAAQWRFGDRYWRDLGQVKATDGTYLQSRAAPSLVSLPEGFVLMTYKGPDDFLCWALFDGSEWINKGRIPF